MKEFPLSTSKERLAGISFSAAMILLFVFLLFVLRNNLMLLVLVGLCAVPLTALLIFYIISITKSTCFVDKEHRTIEVRGFPSYQLDISSAVMLQTVSRRSSHSMTRTLVFTDAQEQIVAAVPTLYTFRRGLKAEPMAKEMAAYLGLEFQANVPAWEYDKEAWKQHQIEEAEKNKKERQERIAHRRKKLENKYKK